MKLIDLSRDIEHNMPVYPGDIAVSVQQIKHLKQDQYNNYRLSTGMHAGTHIDSPMHLTEYDSYISEAPLESFIGPGCFIDATGQNRIEMKPAYESIVAENSIVLLYTGWDKHYGTEEYYQNAPVVSMELCEFFISRKIKMLGMDMASPDRYPFEVHKALFVQGIYVLENLTNLDRLVGVRDFEVVALPLKIKADSAPVRAAAILR